MRRRRTNLQLSQEKLAFQSRLDRTYISLIRKRRKKPIINTLFPLARALKVRPTQLIEECLNY
ncbi:helix-turn-helix domain-containing protein [Bacillus sp. RCC_6_1]|uniref:helix-turn-helix domain-containing protein n=1 Tax=Bacillus sp. RCC_6_1 TaxID=3239229 RepID=UPI00352371AD